PPRPSCHATKRPLSREQPLESRAATSTMTEHSVSRPVPAAGSLCAGPRPVHERAPGTMYGLSDEDLHIQARARAFTDELIPFEVDAELNGGHLPKDVVAGHKARAIELGLFATNMPKALGGQGCTSLQQVLVQEQVGRVTNALAWVVATPP